MKITARVITVLTGLALLLAGLVSLYCWQDWLRVLLAAHHLLPVPPHSLWLP